MRCPLCKNLTKMQIIGEKDLLDVWECPACGYKQSLEPECQEDDD